MTRADSVVLADSTLHFTVDAALLRELGERLVGRPHIALAELIKNSYDADATEVVVTVSNDRIEVADDGHGMTFDEFERFWMRIGSPHKEQQARSRERHRPLTGSKGVGRLAVQFLASEMALITRAKRGEVLSAEVDWTKAVQSVDLTRAEAHYQRRRGTVPSGSLPAGSTHGTRITLSDLRHAWEAEDFADLAREVWALQPPFGGRGTSDFRIVLDSADQNLVDSFDTQMRAWLHLWHARIRGRSVGRSRGALKVVASLEFEGESTREVEYSVPAAGIHEVDFEVRIYSLHHKQRYGIRVDDARNYLRQNGGVHIYDAGFHLPYYGPDTDWLHVEADHAHRLSRSALLPEELQVPSGLNFLPTNARLYGVVNVDTGLERSKATGRSPESLEIQVSRDRLVGNRAFAGLTRTVRWALDFYAMEEARRAFESATRSRSALPLPSKLDELSELLAHSRNAIEPETYDILDRAVMSVVRASRAERDARESEAALLGSLATAGMAALATEHEISLQIDEIRDLVRRLRRASRRPSSEVIEPLAIRLADLLERLTATRRLFAPLLDEEDRERRERLRARAVVDSVVSQVRPFLQGVRVTVELDDALLLPAARFADWSALFQNVLINARNAMLDAPRRQILVSAESDGRTRHLFVQDTGAGVDIDSAENLFEPFVRRTNISRERRQLGLGGTGLGLTIVRMIARNADCYVGFAEPDEGYETAFELSWTEQTQ